MIQGIIILILSFFSFPLSMLIETKNKLEEIGEKGTLDIEESETPFLMWVLLVGKTLVCIFFFIIIIWQTIKGILSLKLIFSHFFKAIILFIGYPILGFFQGILFIWAASIIIEILSIFIKDKSKLKGE